MRTGVEVGAADLVYDAPTIELRCGAPAPLVANGGGFVGCQLTKDHDGMHETTVRWDR